MTNISNRPAHYRVVRPFTSSRMRSMTVTNTAARVARNTEIDAKAPTLDLGLGSIILLKRQGKSSVKDIISPTSFRRRLENSPRDGEGRLRSAAQDSDLYVMEKLELRSH